MTIVQAASYLRTLDNVYILTHLKPDGDTLGSAAGLCAALRALGKKAYILPNPDITPRLLPYIKPYLSASQEADPVYVAVDTASPALLPQAYRAFSVALVIDHHPTNSGYATHNCVCSQAAATGEVVFAILQALGVAITPEVALPLYLAIATDTGCFRYANTTAQSHRVAAQLMETDIDATKVNKEMFGIKSRARLKLEGLLLSRMQVFLEERVCVLILTQDIVRQTDATEDDLDNLSELTRVIEGVEIGMLVKETETGGCKVSIRTCAPWDASALCACFGGGGHARAGGCTMDQSPDQAVDRLVSAIDGHMRRADAVAEVL